MKRRILVLAAIAATICLLKCEYPMQPGQTYASILFVRQGGGEKSFYAGTDPVSHKIDMLVTSYDFRDTNYTLSVFVNEGGRLSELISATLQGERTLTGDFRQSTLPTGTWAYLYCVDSSGDSTQITNTALRDSLMALESLVVQNR
jgi:hypothetical protein